MGSPTKELSGSSNVDSTEQRLRLFDPDPVELRGTVASAWRHAEVPGARCRGVRVRIVGVDY